MPGIVGGGANPPPQQRYVLTYNQIENLWVKNGGDPKLAPTMAAIAFAESAGNTQAHNGNASTGDDSYGLWQINYFNGLYPSRTARFGSPQQLLSDPNRQAQAAVALAQGGRGLSNWSTYTSGAYKRYLAGGGLGGVIHAIGNAPIIGGVVSPNQIGTGVGDVLHPGRILDPLLSRLAGALAVIGGLLLALLGLALVGADIGIEQLSANRAVKATRARIPRPGSGNSNDDESDRPVGERSRKAQKKVGFEPPNEGKERRARIRDQASRAKQSDEVPF